MLKERWQAETALRGHKAIFRGYADRWDYLLHRAGPVIIEVDYDAQAGIGQWNGKEGIKDWIKNKLTV